MCLALSVKRVICGPCSAGGGDKHSNYVHKLKQNEHVELIRAFFGGLI